MRKDTPPPFSSNLTEINIVTTSHSPTLTEQEFASAIRFALIAQDAVANAIAREFVRRTTSRPADWPGGVFLLAGPNQDNAHLIIAGCLAEVLPAPAAAFNMELGWGAGPLPLQIDLHSQ
ncbi:hypothetical protein ACFOYU_16765 [Microvirga sp. GCM10011540]|uniref:hypothetical protein n=1 Tax=Microvirga sp. GCM10011540 TaxID=3317338 RepID=UPI0036091077